MRRTKGEGEPCECPQCLRLRTTIERDRERQRVVEVPTRRFSVVLVYCNERQVQEDLKIGGVEVQRTKEPLFGNFVLLIRIVADTLID